MTRHPLRPLAACAALALGLTLAGCGSSSDDTADTGASTAPDATTGASTATTRAGASTTASSASTTAATSPDNTASTEAGPVVIEASVAGGKVTVEKDRFEVAKGSDVVIRVTDDVEEPIHLHGYDIETDAAPGKPAEISFTADVPGVFEVELEDSGTLLFEIEVK